MRKLTKETDAPHADEDARLRAWQIRIFLLCWIAYFLIYFGRMNLSVAIGALETQFSGGKASVGFLGSLFFWIYAVGKLVNGYRGDRANNRRQVFLGLAVSGICNLLIGFAEHLWMIMVLWAINGFAQSALWCNIISLVSNWFFPRQHAKTAVWLSTSMVGGALAGWGVCGWIISHLSWQWVFLLPGAILLAFSCCWLMLSKNKAPDAGFAGVSASPASTSGTVVSPVPLLKFWAGAGLIPVLAACLAQGVVKDSIGLWGPDMIGGAYGLDAGTASFMLLFIPIMNFFGIALAGTLQTRFRLTDTAAAITLMLAAAGCIGGLQLFLGRSLLGGIFWLGAVSAVMYGVNTIMLGVFPLRFADSGRISFVSGLLDFSSYLAAGASSVFAGFVLDRGLGWGAVFIVWQALTLTGLAALFWIRLRSTRK